MPLYFNAGELRPPKGEYVAWVDGMGTGRALESSLPTAANFVMKLHLAFAKVTTPAGIRLYPLMDGVYVTSADRSELVGYLRDVYKHLAAEFLAHGGVMKRFLVRTGIAYGASIHGDSVCDGAFESSCEEIPKETMDRLTEIRSRLLLSSSMLSAYESESKAAPFGFYIHQSALTVPQLVHGKDRGFQARFWKWWDKESRDEATALAKGIRNYYEEASKMTRSLAYPRDRLDEHRESFEEYYADLLNDQTPSDIE